MKKNELARLLAKRNGITTGAAADRLDRLVSDIVKSLRRGEAANLPGLGEFRPGPVPRFEFDAAARRGKNSRQSGEK